jgi:dTDP-4-amino-4,6-dideoxy-D-glucose acyltransferase
MNPTIGYYSQEELLQFGFSAVGRNVNISKTGTLYNCHNIRIGDNVRIDNFCTIAISGNAKLSIGNYVHISAYNFFNGNADLTLEDFVTTAPFVRIFTSTDDYSGNTMTGAVVPKELIGTISGNVLIRTHVIIGAGATIMPGIILAKGTAVGAHSFVKHTTSELDMVAGAPARLIGKRNARLFELEKSLHG